ncbi:MAG TPA: proprotein convertase P-domain-containing protein [Tepidisphaeraceae bacterium]|nr:proprotein convertase P-domain-containing protein [Tepidisphaeraceae bacterium]
MHRPLSRTVPSRRREERSVARPAAPHARRMMETLENRVLFAAGDLDTTFGGGDGVALVGLPTTLIDEAKAVAVQSDGKVLLAGSSSTDNNFGGNFLVARLNTDGSMDTSFGTGGLVEMDFGAEDGIEDLLIQPDGKIVVGGWTGTLNNATTANFALARLNTNGTPDTTFGLSGRVVTDFAGSEDRIYALALQPDNKILAVGRGTVSGNQLGVVRYTASGVPDSTFGAAGKVNMSIWSNNATGYAVALQPDNKIVIAADASSGGPAGGVATLGLVRLSPSGIPDATFGTGAHGTGAVVDNVGITHPTGLVLDNTGNIYVAGTVLDTGTNTHSTKLFKYTPTGSKVTTFGSGGAVTISPGGFFAFPVGLAMQGDGKLVVAATSNTTGGTDGAWTVARVTQAGVLDSTFGTGGRVTTPGGLQAAGYDVAIAPDGKVVVGGYSLNNMMAARYFGDAGLPQDPGTISGVVYQDNDADGVRDVGEPGLADWMVYLDLNNNGVLDGGTSTVTRTEEPPRQIPDGTGVAVSDLVVSGLGGTVSDVNVTLNITHPYVSDLAVYLISPTGTRVRLLQDVGGAGDNFTNTTLDDEASQSINLGAAPFTGRYRPQQSLSLVDGQTIDGTWRLEVRDLFTDFAGTLDSWSLTFATAAEPSTLTASDGTYTLASVVPGTYTVREVVKTGFTQTAPAGGAHTVVVTSGQAVTGIDFGNFNGILPATVVGRRVFYNNSAFDGRNSAANPQDDAAVAPDKQGLLPGQRATSANVTSYSKGINGVIVDVQRPGGAIQPNDLQFSAGTGGNPALWDAVSPSQVVVRPGAGPNGTTRINVTFADGTIRNMWLRVRVLANSRTGLTQEDVFYVGNLVGESTHVDTSAGPFSVNAHDLVATRGAIGTDPATVANRYDHNRDGRVDVVDFNLLRRNYGRILEALQPPSVAAAFAVVPVTAATTALASARRDEWTSALLG